LLERLEVQMIADVKRKIQKEVTLALAERARDENSALPTDLWKRAVGRILYTRKNVSFSSTAACASAVLNRFLKF